MSTPNRRVLLVDDEPAVLSALSRTVRWDGYQVLTASTAAQALSILKTTGAEVIITDQMMPDVSGLDLLREVRRDFPDTVRMILTGVSDLDLALRAVKEGEIYRFLTKPWDDVDLRVSLMLAFDYRTLKLEHSSLKEELERQKLALAALNGQGSEARPTIASPT
jgi:DNA-binding NtrC family response regulator